MSCMLQRIFSPVWLLAGWCLFVSPLLAQTKAEGVIALRIAQSERQTMAKAGTASISGQVAVSGNPAAGIVIGLFKSDGLRISDKTPVQSVMTEANGHYTITGIAAGQYRVKLLSFGYLSAGNDVDHAAEGRLLSLKESEQVEKFDFKLIKGGMIAGKVEDAVGKLLINVPVWVLRLDAEGNELEVRLNGSPSTTEMTNTRGQFGFYGLPAGRYLVATNVSGKADFNARYARKPAFYPSTTDKAQAKIIEIALGSEFNDVNIRLPYDRPKGYSVVARVVDAQTGKPVSGIHLAYGPTSEREYGAMMGMIEELKTNERGEVRFEDIQPGLYCALLFTMLPDNLKFDYFSDDHLFEVGESDVELEVRARKGATISGTVVVEGVTDPTVLAKLSELQPWIAGRRKGWKNSVSVYPRARQVNSDGTFRVSGVAPGELNFSLIQGTSKGFSLARVEWNGVWQKTPMEVVPGQEVTGVRLVLLYGTALVRGQVKIINGALPAGAQPSVWARRAGSFQPEGLENYAKPDERGNFTYYGLAAGEYEITLNVQLPYVPTVSANGEKAKAPPFLVPVKQKMLVPPSGEAAVTLTLDMSATGNQPKERSNQ